MCHNHTWFNKSFNDHFCNDEIFISFPIVCTQFLQGNFVACYDEFEHEIKTAYNDLDWIFPYQLSIANWNMQTHYFNLKPIAENHHGCKDTVSKFMHTKYQLLQKKILAMEAQVQVMWFL